VNLRQARAGWFWKRLALLLPSLLVAFLVLGSLLRRENAASSILLPALASAALLSAFLAYLVFQTVRAGRAQGRDGLQESRALRRHLRACDVPAIASGLVLALLGALPELLRLEEGEGAPLPPFHRPSSVRRTDVPVGREVAPPVPSSPPAAEAVERRPVPAVPLPPPAAPAARGEPELRPAIVLEPSHLEYSEKDFEVTLDIEVPYIPKRPALAEAPLLQENGPIPSRPTLEDFREQLRGDQVRWGLLARPLPDEWDPEGWPDPEVRLQGFFLIGGDRNRVPGLEVALDLPFGREDSIEVALMAARMPVPEGADVHESANWRHLTLAYVRRLSGYTSHATFDLAAGVGVNADFFHSVQGIPDSGSGPKFAPCVFVDVSFWQYEVVGLLLHVGQSVPVTLVGSSLGATDFRAELRWDLSRRISVRAGYKVLLLRYKTDEVALIPGTELLKGTLAGPAVSLDVRF
jgi:hypothetical protein